MCLVPTRPSQAAKEIEVVQEIAIADRPKRYRVALAMKASGKATQGCHCPATILYREFRHFRGFFEVFYLPRFKAKKLIFIRFNLRLLCPEAENIIPFFSPTQQGVKNRKSTWNELLDEIQKRLKIRIRSVFSSGFHPYCTANRRSGWNGLAARPPPAPSLLTNQFWKKLGKPSPKVQKLLCNQKSIGEFRVNAI